MNTDELMIGDWVIANEEGATRINDLSQWEDLIGVVPTIENKAKTIIMLPADIKPIPITKENLKLNGLVCNNGYNRYDYIQRFDNQFLSVSFYQDTIDVEIYHDDRDRKFEGSLEYIHELQHALRLCGMNELADNWKME